MKKRRTRTAGGIELTDDVIERLAREAERGYDVERLKRTGRRGRPPLGSSAGTTFQVRLDPELREGLEACADAERTTPSDIMRRALRRYVESTSHDKRASGGVEGDRRRRRSS